MNTITVFIFCFSQHLVNHSKKTYFFSVLLLIIFILLFIANE